MSPLTRGMTTLVSVGVITVAVTACSTAPTGSKSTAAAGPTASAAGPTASAAGPTAPNSSVSTCSPTAAIAGASADVTAAQKNLVQAAATNATWDGPTSGAKAQKSGATMVFIPLTSSNAGDLGVEKGFIQAATALGWKVKVIDGGGGATTYVTALNQAIALKPAGIAVSSLDPVVSEPAFAKAKSLHIAVVGNHIGNGPGPQSTAPSMFTNVTSDPAKIASIAVDCAIVASGGKAGVTISGCGTEVSICKLKEDAMETEMRTCPGCQLLTRHDYPFEDAQNREGSIATSDLQKFGKKLTHMLSINDIYWDGAIPAVKAAGVGPSGPPTMIAAGDGSPAAFQRIRQDQYQIATVAEPLNEHGWQMADEMNRALAGAQPSGYVTYPHIVIKANVDAAGGKNNTYDPENGYQTQYKKVWGVS